MNIKTTGIDHIHLNVHAMDSVVDIFTGLLQCQHNIPLYIDVIQGMNSMNSLGIDVFMPVEINGMLSKIMRKSKGQGLTTIAFHVDDIDLAMASFAKQGITPYSEIGYPGIERQAQYSIVELPDMTLELVQWEQGAEEKIAAIKKQQARANNGILEISAQDGALSHKGIHHLLLHVRDLNAAKDRYTQLFDCTWQLSNGIARASTGLYLREQKNLGLQSLAIAVDDLQAASQRATTLGLIHIESHTNESEKNEVAFSHENLLGATLVLVQH